MVGLSRRGRLNPGAFGQGRMGSDVDITQEALDKVDAAMNRPSFLGLALSVWLILVAVGQGQSPPGTSLAPGSAEDSVGERVVFSSDGKLLSAAINYNRTGVKPKGRIVLWDVAAQRTVADFADQDGILWCLAFTPDGRRLAVGNHNESLHLWDGSRGWPSATSEDLIASAVAADRKQRDPREGPRPIQNLAISPDGSLLAYGWERTKTVRVWQLDRREEIAVLQTGGPCNSLTFSPDGKLLIAGIAIPRGKRGGDVQFWDVATFKKKGAVGASRIGGVFATLSPDGRLLAVVSGMVYTQGPRETQIYEMATGRSASLSADFRLMPCVAFAPDGTHLAQGVEARPATVVLWETATSQRAGNLQAGAGWATWSVAFSPDGRYLAAGVGACADPVWLWKLPSHETSDSRSQ